MKWLTKRKLYNAVGLLWGFVRWMGTRLLLRRTPLISLANGVRVGEFASFSEYRFRHLGLDPEDYDVMRAVIDSIERPAVAADIGANLGMFSLALASIGFDIVHAFEPIPDTCERLQANIRRNTELTERIVVNSSAVGAFDGAVTLVLNRRSPGQSKLAGADVQSRVVETIDREIVKLDSYFASPTVLAPAFLKIDVEGFETDVLRGAGNLLGSGKLRFIYIEVIEHALAEAGSSIANLTQLLEGAGYGPVIIEGGIVRATPFTEAMQRAGDRRNVLFRLR